MDTNTLAEKLNHDVFSREYLYTQAKQLNPDFKETQVRHLLGKMLDKNTIIRVSRNRYCVAKETMYVYQNHYSDAAQDVVEFMKEHYPLLDFRVWELCWLNEFFNHQIARNKIFVEVENDGCGYVFSSLQERMEDLVQLKPSQEELYLYGRDNGIIVDRLVSESPKGEPNSYNVPLEKIIVDLFANKRLKGMVSQGDYPLALTEMFEKYQIDQSKLFRYARRRNKEKTIRSYIENHTDIKLVGE